MSNTVRQSSRLPRRAARLLIRLARNVILALLVTSAVSLVITWVRPAKWLQNLVVNGFVLLPALLAGLLDALGRTPRQIKTWILILFTTALIVVPIATTLSGGFAGIISPALYGVDGTLQIRRCAPSHGCDGFFTGRDHINGIVPVKNDDVSKYQLHPGAVLQARIYATNADPGREDWAGLEINPSTIRMSIPKAVLTTTSVFIPWCIAGLALVIYRVRNRSLEGLWAAATAPFRGKTFGGTCMLLGIMVAAPATVAFAYCLLKDLSEPSGYSAFHVMGLGSDGWLTVAGLGVALFAWGITEGRPSIMVGRASTPALTAAMFYVLLTAVVVTYVLAGPAMARLVPPELQSDLSRTFGPMRRFGDVFNPSLIVANLALAIALLAFAMQASTFAGLQRIRARDAPPIGLRVMRERVAPELLYLLVSGPPCSAEALRERLPPRPPSARVVKRTLQRLEDAGAVFRTLSEGEQECTYEPTSRGRTVAVALNDLL
jgi:DNA-binding HxlR family transcriptional regulator